MLCNSSSVSAINLISSAYRNNVMLRIIYETSQRSKGLKNIKLVFHGSSETFKTKRCNKMYLVIYVKLEINRKLNLCAILGRIWVNSILYDKQEKIVSQSAKSAIWHINYWFRRTLNGIFISKSVSKYPSGVQFN
jgi:hypothetical protein